MTDEPDEPDEPDEDSVEDTHDLESVPDQVHLDQPVDAIPRGAIVGSYVILGQIASSGTGVVYGAFDPERDRKIALKLLPIEDDEPAEANRRRIEVVDRIESTRVVDHPSVVEIYDVRTYNGGVAVAMEFIDGINLRQWMEARDDPFPWPEVLRVFRAVGRGLAAAHGAGVVHGDFKPDSVLMAKKGRICILDFGLANEIVEEEPALDLTELKDALPGVLSTHEDAISELQNMGPVMGTPAYMAPERHVGAAGDPKTDQFSFCVAFYEALYGERPFRGNRRATIADATIHNRIRPAPDNSNVPAWLRVVLLRGLSARRGDRYASMAALLRELDHDPIASRRRWLLGLGVMGTLGAAAAVVAYLMYFESAACEADETQLAGIWDPNTRAELRSVFEVSGRPHAEDSWRAVEARLDEWMTEWLDLRELACRATRVRREASEELLERRNACLDARLDEVAAFSRVYAGANPGMIDHARRLVDEIGLPHSCVSLETLQTTAIAPESIRPEVAELRHLENDAWLALLAGNVALARSGANAVSERLSEVEYGPLRVHNALLLGLIARSEGDPSRTEAQLQEAAALANAEGLQQLSAWAWLELLDEAAKDPGRLRETQVWATHADRAIERLGDDRLRSRLFQARGDIAQAQGKAGDALTMYHRGLELLERSDDPSVVRVADTLLRLGELVAQRGEQVSAQRYFERAVELRQQAYGRSHPEVATALKRLGHTRLAQEDFDGAIADFERAGTIFAGSGGDPLRTSAVDLALGRAELQRARTAAAAAHFARAAETLRPVPDGSTQLPEALIGLGRTRIELRQFDAAKLAAEEALPLLEGKETDPVARGQARELLAAVLWEDPETQEQAIEMAAAAIDDFLAAGTNGVPHRQRIRAWLDARQP